jgi:hypothetical protein
VGGATHQVYLGFALIEIGYSTTAFFLKWIAIELCPDFVSRLNENIGESGRDQELMATGHTIAKLALSLSFPASLKYHFLSLLSFQFFDQICLFPAIEDGRKSERAPGGLTEGIADFIKTT